MRFLSHISGSRPMKLPFFLYKSLTKVYQKIWWTQNYFLHNIYHQGLTENVVVISFEEEEIHVGKISNVWGFQWNYFKKESGKAFNTKEPGFYHWGRIESPTYANPFKSWTYQHIVWPISISIKQDNLKINIILGLFTKLSVFTTFSIGSSLFLS